jgi:AcrR family transcriptional regulator
MKADRGYSMTVRNAKAATTRRRILEATRELFAAPFGEFTLEMVASAAGTSVQTVLRAYGNKESLLVEAIGSARPGQSVLGHPPPSVREALAQLLDDYEQTGDRVIRMLAEEHRIPGLAPVAREVRSGHRVWVSSSFGPQLARHPDPAREQILLALLAATDVHVWKVLRRDLGLDRTATQSIVERLVRGVLADHVGD